MKPIRSALHRLLLATCLLPLALPAQSAEPKSNQGAALIQPVAEPVQRLIIRYRDDGQKTDRAVAASAADERVKAAAQVAHSAGLARVQGLRYLKSVSPQLHVARLDRPLPAGEAQALIDRLRADPAVASVTVDQRVRPHAVTDPYVTFAGSPYYQWHLQSPSTVPGGINAAAAWGSSTGTGVTVAVLDGGYRPHADLLGNLLTASDFDFISADPDNTFWTANDGNARDDNAEDPGDWIPPADASRCPEGEPVSSWHGTHVTGLVGAVANGTEGVGIAHGGRVLPVRVLGRCGGYLSDIYAGMRWAAGLSVDDVVKNTTPVKVLNLSLGIGGACDPNTQSVIDEVRKQGVSIVASTGNESRTAITKPANCMGVLAVTAHTIRGTNAEYANVGPRTAISAPGGDDEDAVASTWNLGTTVPGADSYGRMYGTSMAAPQVAGVLALMAAARNDLALPTLEALMRGAVRAFPDGDYCVTNPDNLPPNFCGSGLLDAGLAVSSAVSAPVTKPDLEILQRVDALSWEPGSTVTLLIQVRNWGSATATSVDLNVSLIGLEILSVSGLNASIDTSSLRAFAGDIATRAERQLTVTARVTAADALAVTSIANAQSQEDEITLLNNTHRLDPMGEITEIQVEAESTDSGGGCTVAPTGQADAGLPLLALAAVLALLWRRRIRVSAVRR